MKDEIPQIRLMGERAILVEFEPEMREEKLDILLFYKNLLQNFYGEEKVEVINTYSSLLIFYISGIENIYGEISVIEELVSGANIDKLNQRQLFYLPVCYDSKFGPDLEVISSQNKLSFQEIISLHTYPTYTVFFTGFLPGFLYLGGLDSRLYISRKNVPRLEVQKGAVGIGEKQTGIYPKTSPGGWQIIGNSPVPLFDKNKIPPCQISAGDKIRFYSISVPEHEEILQEVQSGDFRIKKEIYGG